MLRGEWAQSPPTPPVHPVDLLHLKGKEEHPTRAAGQRHQRPAHARACPRVPATRADHDTPKQGGELPSTQPRPTGPAPDTKAGGRKERPPWVSPAPAKRWGWVSRSGGPPRPFPGGALLDTPPGPREGQEAVPGLLDCNQKAGCPANPPP